MMLRISQLHGTLRHSSSSIAGLPHNDAPLPFATPSLLVCLFILISHSSFLWSPVCIYFNPGFFHLIFPLCCCIIVIIDESCLISPRFIHLLHLFPSLCYAHFIYSPHSLAFIFILYHSRRAGITCRYSTRSCLLLTPSFPLSSLVAPFLSSLSYIVPRPIRHVLTHAPPSRICTTHILSHTLPPLASNIILYRLALV
jgi:hypothetical protein